MIFKNNYIIKEKVCETSASIIYKCCHLVTQKKLCIKIEKNSSSTSYLENETKIRKFLENIKGIPKITDYGFYKSRRFIIYPFISQTLHEVNMNINKDQIFNCGYQLLEIIMDIHNAGIVHCDISSFNVFCNGNIDTFYLSDFGQAKNFTFALCNNFCTNKLVGSPLYCSENVHLSHEYSYRDDLISIGYLLYFCFNKILPWSGLKNTRLIFEKKKEFREKYGSLSMPKELKIYFNYCFHLGINQKPEYIMLKKLFDYDYTNKEITIET